MNEIKNQREVCWDFDLADKIENVTICEHKPVRRNNIMTADMPWEGCACGYCSIVTTDEGYRMYYRASGLKDGTSADFELGNICVAESKDGKNFIRPNLKLVENKGSYDNNIVKINNPPYSTKLGLFIDNFSVYCDENPDCPPDEKFKALALYELEKCDLSNMSENLAYYKSSDGYTFDFVRVLDIKGCFDSLNTIMWDKDAGKYRAYVRGAHFSENTQLTMRDVRMTESEDMIHWTEPEIIIYENEAEEWQVYTNGMKKYPRANVFVGTPTGYLERKEDTDSLKRISPLLGDVRKDWVAAGDRSGYAFTESYIVTSRDGVHFKKSYEPFMGPGVENGENWIYGDGYPSWGFIETESDFPGEPNELSFYMSRGYRQRPVDIARYAIRLDGFRSWKAGAEAGCVMTKPLTFDGSTLKVNFETTVFGNLKITICDENGTPIPGYESGNIFGNTIDREVDFEKDLAEFAGKTVRLKFDMRLAEIYSFIVE